MRSIEWRCEIIPKWEWLSGAPRNPSISAEGDNVRKGTISLPPNKDYWYTCMNVILQGDCIGNAYICYFKDHGKDMIQAITVAQNVWICEGNINSSVSMTQAEGGINLVARFID